MGFLKIKKTKQTKNQEFFVINEFKVPKVYENDFIDYYKTNIELLVSHKGNIDCRFFRLKEEGPIITYMSIIGWENEESLRNAKIEIDYIGRKTGLDVLDFKDKHDIEVIHRIFTEVQVL